LQSLQHVVSKYDTLAGEYDRRYSGEEGSPGFKLFLGLYDQLTWRYIEPYLPPDKSAPILDAGGGTGKWALRIAQQGYRDVRILDLSPEMLNRAEKRFAEAGLKDVLTLQAGDIRDLPWPEDTFAFILSEGDPVGYCLSDYAQAISELVRVCLPEGTIVIAVDDLLIHYLGALQMTGLEAARQLLETRTAKCPYELPVRCFTPKEIREAFDAAGADVLKVLNKPALTHLLRDQTRSKFLEDQALQQALFEAEVWACEEGYITAGSHLQVVARKRNRLQEDRP
jgi:ubiquinone/menaquinone biosynthesis C-methylase UbiE